PIDSFDSYALLTVPSWNGPANLQRLQAGLRQVVDRVGPSVLMNHSQSGRLGWHVTVDRPDTVKGLIQIEPIEPSRDLTDPEVHNLTRMPILVLWGDFISGDAFWTGHRELNRQLAKRIVDAGGDVTFVDLPEQGIHGNSHIMMFDQNSEEVAALIYCW